MYPASSVIGKLNIKLDTTFLSDLGILGKKRLSYFSVLCLVFSVENMNLSPFSIQEEALLPGDLIAMKSFLANSSEI